MEGSDTVLLGAPSEKQQQQAGTRGLAPSSAPAAPASCAASALSAKLQVPRWMSAMAPASPAACSAGGQTPGERDR